MGWMRDKSFADAIHTGADTRRKGDREIKEWERRADENPLWVAATLMKSTIYWRRVWRRRYRQLAKKAKRRVVSESEHAWFVTLELGSPSENGSMMLALWEATLWETIFWSMLDAAVEAKNTNKDPDRAACKEFLLAQRRSYEILATVTFPEFMPPEMRNGIGGVLTGQVGAQISLAHNRRLEAAMGEGGDRPRERLDQELPSAVLCEWGDPCDSYSPLLQRVARLLESERSEQGRLAWSGKLADDTTDEVGLEDEDVAEFERQETLRQELSQLEGWVQGAGFSAGEAQVFELDMETNFDTKAIAQELEKSPSTVRQFRKRYLDKIRQAAGL